MTLGHAERAGSWPRQPPIGKLLGLALALVGCGGLFLLQTRLLATPLQRWYLRAAVVNHGQRIVGIRTGTYRVLTLVGPGRRSRVAVDTDFQVFAPPTYQVSAHAAAEGFDAAIVLRSVSDTEAFHRLLVTYIYQDREWWQWARWPLIGSGLLLIAGLAWGSRRDQRRKRQVRHGHRLRGSEVLLDAARFNAAVNGDGFALALANGETLRLPQARDVNHYMVAGDNGSGKTTIISQIGGYVESGRAAHVDRRSALRRFVMQGHLQRFNTENPICVFIDPAMDYIEQFHDAARGDHVMNPYDRRCPSWDFPLELQRVDPRQFAHSLIPDATGHDRDNAFFRDASRSIVAHLAAFRPSIQELAAWLQDPEELDRRLAVKINGVSYEHLIARDSGPMRLSVFASLNLVVPSLGLMARLPTSSVSWAASDWASTREGWLFFTSTPATRATLAPLHSVWLDTIILSLMDNLRKHGRPVWLLVDELAALRVVPQLPTALVEFRKYGHTVVIGFQSRKQIDRYGDDAETMRSQTRTKCIGRMTEGDSAKWASGLLGDLEMERLHETRSKSLAGALSGFRVNQSLENHRETTPLVMASDIQGLEDLQTVVRHGRHAASVTVAYWRKPKQAEAFLPQPSAPPTNLTAFSHGLPGASTALTVIPAPQTAPVDDMLSL